MLRRSSAATAALWVAALVGAAPAAVAAGPEQSDWPCQQRLVPKLAAGAFWNGPSLDGIGDWHADPAVAALVQRLASRRISIEEGLTAIAAFAGSLSGHRARGLVLAFRGLLDETDRERSAVIDALNLIGRRQRELAGLASRLGAELDAMPIEATGEAAARRLDLEQRRDFTVRNFEEIGRTIRYACEIPVTLDARLGAWARALQKLAAQ
jgi:hypothetical protein